MDLIVAKKLIGSRGYPCLFLVALRAHRPRCTKHSQVSSSPVAYQGILDVLPRAVPCVSGPWCIDKRNYRNMDMSTGFLNLM